MTTLALTALPAAAPLRGFVYGLPAALRKGGRGRRGVVTVGVVVWFSGKPKARVLRCGLLCNEAKRLTLFVRLSLRALLRLFLL